MLLFVLCDAFNSFFVMILQEKNDGKNCGSIKSIGQSVGKRYKYLWLGSNTIHSIWFFDGYLIQSFREWVC